MIHIRILRQSYELERSIITVEQKDLYFILTMLENNENVITYNIVTVTPYEITTVADLKKEFNIPTEAFPKFNLKKV